jgi:hypothetical protein
MPEQIDILRVLASQLQQLTSGNNIVTTRGGRRIELLGDTLSPAEKMELTKASLESPEAFAEWAEALSLPLEVELDRESTVRNIFQVVPLDHNSPPTFPVLSTDEQQGAAWVVPGLMLQPTQMIVADTVTVNTFEITSSIEWKRQFQRDGRFDVAAKCTNIMKQAVLVTEEDKGWALLKTASTKMNSAVTIADGSPGAGYLSKELINLLDVRMARHPTNTRQQRGYQLTNLYANNERLADIREWTTTTIDPTTQREIFQNAGLNGIWDIALNQYYFLEGTEVYGFDLRESANLGVMPIAQPLITRPLVASEDRWRVGVKCLEEVGFAVLNARAIIKGTIST